MRKIFRHLKNHQVETSNSVQQTPSVCFVRMSALQAYRTALRATRIAFQQDIPVLTAARVKIREGFEEHRNLSDESVIQEEISKLNDVSQFLTRNIVQAKQQESGKYLLDIHSETELGDNESIKNPKKDMGSLAGVKSCSGLKR